MNNDQDYLNYNKSLEEINQLSKDNLLSAVLIGVTIITIIGNNVYKKYYETGLKRYVNESKKYYIASLTIALGIYLIFEKSNLNNLNEKIMNSDNPKPAFIRLVGSVLIVIGTLCFIYYQLNEEYPGGGPEE